MHPTAASELFKNRKSMDIYEKIEILKVLTRFRLDEISREKFPMLADMRFSADDILNLIQLALTRYKGE